MQKKCAIILSKINKSPDFFSTNCQNINFPRCWYFRNILFLGVNTLLLYQKSVEFVIFRNKFLKYELFSRLIYFKYAVFWLNMLLFVKNWQKSRLIVLIRIFLAADIFERVIYFFLHKHAIITSETSEIHDILWQSAEFLDQTMLILVEIRFSFLLSL